MSKPITDQPEGATPIDDVSGLLQEITTRGELNDAEALNIINADEWLYTARMDDLFTVRFYCELHARMYDQVWSWAGKLRTQTAVVSSIGSAPQEVTQHLGQVALEFNREWKARSNMDDLISFIARYHHALVLVHPFNNGNGRWSRLACDAMIARLTDHPPLVWATDILAVDSEQRHVYIEALRRADGGDFEPLTNYLMALNAAVAKG